MNFSYIDDPMCPGKVATYSCNAGGINVFKVVDLFKLVLFLNKQCNNLRSMVAFTVHSDGLYICVSKASDIRNNISTKQIAHPY